VGDPPNSDLTASLLADRPIGVNNTNRVTIVIDMPQKVIITITASLLWNGETKLQRAGKNTLRSQHPSRATMNVYDTVTIPWYENIWYDTVTIPYFLKTITASLLEEVNRSYNKQGSTLTGVNPVASDDEHVTIPYVPRC
jgi:hypothetical protein